MRKNAFYQLVRNSDVHYAPISHKNPNIMATFPMKLENRKQINHSALAASKKAKKVLFANLD